MRRTDKRMRLCCVLLVLNLAVIWGNSLIPGHISGQISGFVTELIGKLLGMTAQESEGGHGLLRKMAHFSEFACLGALLFWRLAMGGQTGRALRCQTLLGGLSAACVDETIQLFVDGRASSLIDVWIDFCGAAVGMTVLLFGHHLLKNKNIRILWRKQHEEIYCNCSGSDHGTVPVHRLRRRRNSRNRSSHRGYCLCRGHHGRTAEQGYREAAR